MKFIWKSILADIILLSHYCMLYIPRIIARVWHFFSNFSQMEGVLDQFPTLIICNNWCFCLKIGVYPQCNCIRGSDFHWEEGRNQSFDVVDGSLVGSACFYYLSQEKNCTGEEVGQIRRKTRRFLQKNIGVHQSCKSLQISPATWGLWKIQFSIFL